MPLSWRRKNKMRLTNNIKYIPLDKLKFGSNNGVRQRPIDIGELRKRFGNKLKEELFLPLLVIDNGEEYIVFDGQHRCTFLAVVLELPKDVEVPCLVVKVDKRNAVQMANHYFTEIQAVATKPLTNDQLAVPRMCGGHDTEMRRIKKILIECNLCITNFLYFEGSSSACKSLEEKAKEDAVKYNLNSVASLPKEWWNTHEERVEYKPFKTLVGKLEKAYKRIYKKPCDIEATYTKEFLENYREFIKPLFPKSRKMYMSSLLNVLADHLDIHDMKLYFNQFADMIKENRNWAGWKSLPNDDRTAIRYGWASYRKTGEIPNLTRERNKITKAKLV